MIILKLPQGFGTSCKILSLGSSPPGDDKGRLGFSHFKCLLTGLCNYVEANQSKGHRRCTTVSGPRKVKRITES